MNRKQRIQKAQEERQALLAKMAKLTFRVSEEEFYRFENPDGEERDTVPFIRRYLLSEEQRKRLFDLNLSVEDLLNGRYTESQEAEVLSIFADWNKKLGYESFNPGCTIAELKGAIDKNLRNL